MTSKARDAHSNDIAGRTTIEPLLANLGGGVAELIPIASTRARACRGNARLHRKYHTCHCCDCLLHGFCHWLRRDVPAEKKLDGKPFAIFRLLGFQVVKLEPKWIRRAGRTAELSVEDNVSKYVEIKLSYS